MAVAFVKHIGTFATKTAGTTMAWLWPSSSAAGNLIVCYLVFDNAATTLKPVVTSISKMAGETASWVFLGASRSPGVTSGAASSGEMWAIQTTVAWTTPTITATFDTSIAMKSMGFSEFSGANATLRSTSGTHYQASGTTASSSTTTGTAPVIGDLALGLLFGSNVATPQLGDSDTTGGVWSAVQGIGSTGGAVATNNMGVFQYKVVTTTAHQQYQNQAAMTVGNGTIVAILQAGAEVTPVASISASASTISQGTTVTFTDTSTNGPTTWAWIFGSGSSPATAATKGPHTVTYSTLGTSSVTLTAGNGAGSDAVDTPTSITVTLPRYAQVPDWSTPGTAGTGGYYKDIALTGLAAGDLLVAFGANNDYFDGTVRSITTFAGTTSAWTTQAPTVVADADCDFISGWATVTSGTTATVRVQLRGINPQMIGAGVWVIPAADWSGTPAYTLIGPTDVDTLVSVTIAATSTVLYSIGEWNLATIPATSTPSEGVVGTHVFVPTKYVIESRSWTAQAAGTRNYGMPGVSGADAVGAVWAVPVGGGAAPVLTRNIRMSNAALQGSFTR